MESPAKADRKASSQPAESAMSPQRWHKVKDLFNAALERKPEERNEFLRSVCVEDESLRVEVESLLKAHEDIEVSTAGFAASEIPKTPLGDTMAGRRVGPYQIVRRLAFGGMASVYLAVRADDQYRMRVAIKLVRPELDNQQVLQRFRNERQTLATLDHPNIVKLLDGGSTEDGTPYLVMDYVEGQPIDEHCDSQMLSIPERLQLFRTVCAAVQYAHSKLVIHRDLKPGNILVTVDGVAKLLDFGIAKLLDPELSSHTVVTTQTGMRLMTPGYASPEQVRGNPVTHLTDIYSLGVVLYELLTGHGPYRLRRHTPMEMERAICDYEAERPSTVVQRTEELRSPEGMVLTITPDAVSRMRRTRTEKLCRSLRGDLDSIVLMTLRKEPRLRYASAQELSEDIGRHLEHLPVSARKGTLRYRGAKFLKRHKTQVLAGTLILLSLLAAVMASNWNAHKALEKARAELRLAGKVGPRRSVAVLGFRNLSGRSEVGWLGTALSEMLTTEMAAGETLRTVPGENVARMKLSLPLPEDEALGRDTLARIRQNLGTDLIVLGSYTDLGKESGGQIRLDVRLQDTIAGETIASAAETGTEANLFDLVRRAGLHLRQTLGVGEVGSKDVGSIRVSLPENAEAARLYVEGLEKLRAFDALAAKDLLSRAIALEPNHALAHSALAAAWTALGYEENAKIESKKAFDLSESLSREDRLWIEAHYRETLREWDKAIEIYRSLFTFFPDNLDYGLRLATIQAAARKGQDAMSTVAALRKSPSPGRDDPRIDLAEAAAAESLGDFRQVQVEATNAATKAERQPSLLVLAQALRQQGWALRNLGDIQGALAPMERAKQIYEAVGDRGSMARALNHIALLAGDKGDFGSAISTYKQSLAVSREIGDKRGAAATFNNLALALWQQPGQLPAVRQMFEQLIVTNREIADQVGVALAQYNLGLVLFDLGDLSGAISTQESALRIFRQIDRKSSIAMVEGFLGLLQMHRANFRVARADLEDALAIRTKLGEKAGIALSQLFLGIVAMEEMHWADAEALGRKAAEEFRSEKKPDFEAYAQALLARAEFNQGRREQANATIAQAEALATKVVDPHVRCFVGISSARIAAGMGKSARAVAMFNRALELATAAGLFPYQLEARLGLSEVRLQTGQVNAGKAMLASLEKEAAGKGYLEIAHKAAR
jgi:serine/threonine protein kinase/tetratricopeptide (TPR) repeat protein/TolB-like protein